ncbi:cytochrome P450 [Pseudonocardia alni]|uniref:cytochrome P450 n=1 Tax=Pseudonocardia alni TaxID=33907 RepID=UPI0033C0147F
MTTAAPTVTDDLDPFRVEHLDDPYPLYAALRDRGPAVHLPDRDVWLVSTYSAVSEVLRNYKQFRSGLGTSYIRVADSGFRFPFIDNDPPEHTRIRRSVQGRFHRAEVEKMTTAVRGFVREVCSSPLAEGAADVTTIAKALPNLTIRDLTGVTAPDTDRMAAWADAVFHVLGPDFEPRHMDLTLESLDWLATTGVLDLPMRSLGREILDNGGCAGGLHEGQERLFALASIWIAGIDTTNALINILFDAFARHPEQWAALRADRSLIPAAVEEALRWDAPIRMFLRRTVDPVDLQGVTIPADADVVAIFPAANRDPLAFTDPDSFDITARRRNKHLSFGASIHLCLGAPVARLEATELLSHLADHVGRFEFVAEPVRAKSRVIRNFESLPIRFVRG